MTKQHTVVHEAHNVELRDAPQHFYNSQPAPGHVTSMDQYREMYQQSIEDPEAFFGPMAREHLHWDRPFTKVCSGSLENGDSAWFLNGELNAAYNLSLIHI